MLGQPPCDLLPMNLRAVFALFLIASLLIYPAFAQDVMSIPGDKPTPPWVLASIGERFPAENVKVSLATVADADLFVTVVFHDAPDQTLTLTWTSDGNAITLAENLSEGVMGLNKRTIRLSAAQLTEHGTLSVLSGAGNAAIEKVRLEWLTPRETFIASGEDVPGLLATGGEVIPSAQLAVEPALPPPDFWGEGIVEVSLQEIPEALDGNLEIVVPLDTVPMAGVMKAQLLAVPVGEAPTVWVNGTRIGQMAVMTPELGDIGYLNEDGAMVYAGWRKATIYLPSQVLKPGDNTVLLQSPVQGAYIKNAALQFLPQATAITGVGFTEESAAAAGEDILNQPILITEETTP